MRAYVLCGGFGTRLRSVIQDTQKALVQVHGEPFLMRLLSQLARAGITEAVLCAHYRAEQVAEQLDALASNSGISLHLVIEQTPLGTGGALLNALQEEPAQGRYLVLNADTYLDAAAYQQIMSGSGNAVLAVQVEDRSRYGSLSLDADGFLLALQEKGHEGAGLINAGVYAFEPEAHASRFVRACSLERDLLPELLEQTNVAVIEYSGRFIDIGTPESLERYANDFQADDAR